MTHPIFQFARAINNYQKGTWLCCEALVRAYGEVQARDGTSIPALEGPMRDLAALCDLQSRSTGLAYNHIISAIGELQRDIARQIYAEFLRMTEPTEPTEEAAK